MKNVFVVFGLTFILLLSILIGLTIYSESTRSNELNNIVNTASEQALTNLKLKKQYEINDEDEFVADFVENLIVSINSDSDITVNVLAVDMEKGLLDVEVIEIYQTPIGTTKECSCRKTIILDNIDSSSQNVIITFVTDKLVNGEYTIGGEVFYQEKIQSGNEIIPPENMGISVPTKKDHTFVGWIDEVPNENTQYTKDDCIDFDGVTAFEDTTLYAVFHKN